MVSILGSPGSESDKYAKDLAQRLSLPYITAKVGHQNNQENRCDKKSMYPQLNIYTPIGWKIKKTQAKCNFCCLYKVEEVGLFFCFLFPSFAI